MPVLHDGQQHFRTILAQGPDAFVAGLFAGPNGRALRGLSVHANTISHARLTALEDSFPFCRSYLGEARFNAVSRAYVEEGVTDPHAQIGRRFPSWLHAQPDDLAAAAEIAEFELLWLEAYHAAEAAALTLADLAGLAPEALLGLRMAHHPAARLVYPRLPITHALGLDEAQFGDAGALLITRPEAEIRVHPLGTVAAALFEAMAAAPTLGAALSALIARYPDTDSLALLTALIATGALTRAEDGESA